MASSKGMASLAYAARFSFKFASFFFAFRMAAALRSRADCLEFWRAEVEGVDENAREKDGISWRDEHAFPVWYFNAPNGVR